MKPKRIEYIDVAKFLALVLVVFCHAYKECSLLAFFYSFHLPVFFFLNGMTLKVRDIAFGDFLIKKIKGFIIPMLGLGILTAFCATLISFILNRGVPDNFIFLNLAKIINQTRSFAIWFLPSLFFVNIMMFGIHRLVKGNLILMGACSLSLLGIGLLFNTYYNAPLVWNFDASLFGIIFTYFGFLLTSDKLSRVYHFLFDRRGLSLLLGIGILVGVYFLSSYNYTTFHRHLEMFFRIYTQPYITLPCALLGCFGFVLFCRGITNRFLARPVEINLALLPFHQELAFPIFRNLIAESWWQQVAFLPPSDPRFILFTLTLVAFSLVVATGIHLILKYSPFSAIVNLPPAHFYRKKTSPA